MLTHVDQAQFHARRKQFTLILPSLASPLSGSAAISGAHLPWLARLSTTHDRRPHEGAAIARLNSASQLFWGAFGGRTQLHSHALIAHKGAPAQLQLLRLCLMLVCFLTDFISRGRGCDSRIVR
jgi:hypothetical protein